MTADGDPRAATHKRRHGHTSLLALITMLGGDGVAESATATIGRTWPIAETDALTEIEARANTLPRDLAPKFGPRSGWSAMKAAGLGIVTIARTRKIIPFYTLEADISLPDGRTLYPKGFSFNPLSYVSLPQRLVVVHAAELDWALRTASATDWIILAAGGSGSPDPIALGNKVGRTLFLLEDRVKSRLGLTVAPVIVQQAGQALVLSEIEPPKHVGPAR